MRMKHDFHEGFTHHIHLGITQYLLLAPVDSDNISCLPDHEHRISDQVEQRLVPLLRRRELLRALGDFLLQLGRVALNLLLQQLSFRDISHEGSGIDQAPAFGIKQRGRVNLHINRLAVSSQKDRFNRGAPLRHQLFQIGEDFRLSPLRNDVPQAHAQHFFSRIPQFLQFGLVDMHEVPGLVQLMDHFG